MSKQSKSPLHELINNLKCCGNCANFIVGCMLGETNASAGRVCSTWVNDNRDADWRAIDK